MKKGGPGSIVVPVVTRDKQQQQQVELPSLSVLFVGYPCCHQVFMIVLCAFRHASCFNPPFGHAPCFNPPFTMIASSSSGSWLVVFDAFSLGSRDL